MTFFSKISTSSFYEFYSHYTMVILYKKPLSFFPWIPKWNCLLYMFAIEIPHVCLTYRFSMYKKSSLPNCLRSSNKTYFVYMIYFLYLSFILYSRTGFIQITQRQLNNESFYFIKTNLYIINSSLSCGWSNNNWPYQIAWM